MLAGIRGVKVDHETEQIRLEHLSTRPAEVLDRIFKEIPLILDVLNSTSILSQGYTAFG